MGNKKSFVIYESWATLIANIPAEQAGELIQAICRMKLGEEPVINDPSVAGMFAMIRPQLDADAQRYAEKCDRLKRNSSKSESKNYKSDSICEISDTNCEESETKNYKSGGDSVSVSDSVSDSVSEHPTDAVKKDSCAEQSLGTTIPYQAIIDDYNETCPSLPRVSKITDARRRRIRSVYLKNSMTEIKKAFRMVEESDFLTGRSGKWKASFDWIMAGDNLTKILEGNYANRASPLSEVDDYLARAIGGEG